MEKDKKSLETTTIALMVGVALLYDAVQFLFSYIGLGWIIMPVFYLHFWFWFNWHGIRFFTAKKSAGLGIGFILEAFTAGIAPAFTVNVLLVALDNKIKKAIPNSGIIKP